MPHWSWRRDVVAPDGMAAHLDEPTAVFVQALRESTVAVQWCDGCRLAQGPGRGLCARCGSPLSWQRAQQPPLAVATVWMPAGDDPVAPERGVTLVHLGGEATVLGRVVTGYAPEPGDPVTLAWADGPRPGVLVSRSAEAGSPPRAT